MNFNNENMDMATSSKIIKVLYDKVNDGDEVFIYDRNHGPLSFIMEIDTNFMVTLEQLLINEQRDLHIETFDLNREDHFNLLLLFINEIEIVKFSYNNIFFFSINDEFLKDVIRYNNSLQEHQIVSKILGPLSS